MDGALPERERCMLFLDVSTSRTGVAHGCIGETPESVVWRFDPDEPAWMRHARLARNISELTDDLKDKGRLPYAGGVESPIFATGQQRYGGRPIIQSRDVSYALIGGAAVALATMHLCGIKRMRMPEVRTIRKYFVGAGKADKSQVMMRCQTLRWPFVDNNAADALAGWAWLSAQFSALASVLQLHMGEES